ncbi:hypothetical protein BsWGS_03661 [Bradybaena similaris]
MTTTINTQLYGVFCQSYFQHSSQNQHLHCLKILCQFIIQHSHLSYNPTQWTHVYADGSAQGAVRNRGGGIYIKHSDGRTTKKAIATGKMSSNYRAESMVLLEALRMLGHDENATQGKLVFFTDCKSLLKSLQTPKDSRAVLEDIITELNNLPQSSQVALQWIPSHCDIAGNEIADSLSKTGSN